MTQYKHDGLAVPNRVVLAHEPDFTLGNLRIQPALRQVLADGKSETIEPRVMQALVALARAANEIVTRDELIERCWEGRIVSDDAINRVLSRIRQIANGIGEASFSVQTVARVGYRIVGGSIKQPAAPPISGAKEHRAETSRRTLIARTGAAAIAIGAGALAWQRPWRHRPVAEAEQLYRRGNLLLREGLPGQVRQAISYFQRATVIDPAHSAAWGALALTYSHLLEGFDEAEMASLPARIQSAAERALELDPDDADAQLALIFITPYFRNWAAKEKDLRRHLSRHPQQWLAHGRLGVLLYQVGRLSEGIEQNLAAIKLQPILPTSYNLAIRHLSALGRAQEAEALIEKAQERWPTHPALWFANFDHLLFSGKPKSAIAFASNPDTLPSQFGADEVDPLLRLARAIDTGDPADVESSIEDQRRMILADVRNIRNAVPVFAALGNPDLVFASLDRYFFNRGSFGVSRPIGTYERRYTDMLFTQPMAAVRGDPRFNGILKEVGLQTYWRETGTQPDYQRLG